MVRSAKLCRLPPARRARRAGAIVSRRKRASCCQRTETQAVRVSERASERRNTHARARARTQQQHRKKQTLWNKTSARVCKKQYYRDQLANEQRGAMGFMCGRRRRRRRHRSSGGTKCARFGLYGRACATIPCAGAEELNALNLSYMNGFSISEVDTVHAGAHRWFQRPARYA